MPLKETTFKAMAESRKVHNEKYGPFNHNASTMGCLLVWIDPDKPHYYNVIDSFNSFEEAETVLEEWKAEG
jgi:hypothetical protein